MSSNLNKESCSRATSNYATFRSQVFLAFYAGNKGFQNMHVLLGERHRNTQASGAIGWQIIDVAVFSFLSCQGCLMQDGLGLGRNSKPRTLVHWLSSCRKPGNLAYTQDTLDPNSGPFKDDGFPWLFYLVSWWSIRMNVLNISKNIGLASLWLWAPMSVMSWLPSPSFCPFVRPLNSQHECPIHQNYPKLLCSVACTHSSHRRKEHIPPLDWCGGDLEQLELSPETWKNEARSGWGYLPKHLLWVLQNFIWSSTSPAHSNQILPSHQKLAPFRHAPFLVSWLLMRTHIWFHGFAMLGINMDWTNIWLCIFQSTMQAFGTTKLLWHDLGMQARFQRKQWHLFQMPVNGYAFCSALVGHSRARLGPAHSNSEPKQCSTQTPQVQSGWVATLFGRYR